MKHVSRGHVREKKNPVREPTDFMAYQSINRKHQYKKQKGLPTIAMETNFSLRFESDPVHEKGQYTTPY